MIYVAGLFDGEGNVHIQRVKTDQSPNHKLVVAVANTDLAILDYLQSLFRGVIRQRKTRSPRHSRCDIWILERQHAAAFLKRILPYLRIKKRQAEIGIELQHRISQFGRMYKPKGRGCLLPQSELRAREELREEMRSLNQSKPLLSEVKAIRSSRAKIKQPRLFEGDDAVGT